MDLPDLERWCSLSFAERRDLLASALLEALDGAEGLSGVRIEPGPVGREYDMSAVAETDVGRLRTPLWSHARAGIFCDSSIHPANRVQVGPQQAVREAADRLRRRLAVPYTLESRGLTISWSPEEGVERTWTAEHSLFRKRTAVTREDRVQQAGELDVRDLLAHFYTGPSLRLVSDKGEAMLLPGAGEVEGEVVTLCRGCRHWSDGGHDRCSECGSERVEAVIAARGRSA
jgi:hypothetical protein